MGSACLALLLKLVDNHPTRASLVVVLLGTQLVGGLRAPWVICSGLAYGLLAWISNQHI
jgi:hypothetical protein